MSIEIKTWSHHRCGSVHRTTKAFLVCAMRSLTRDEVSGEGEYALIHESRHHYSNQYGQHWTSYYRVRLFQSRTELAAAYAEQDSIHADGPCSGTCWGMPRAVRVELS